MNKKTEKICIFEVNNVQRDYALCLQFIKMCESADYDIEKKKNSLWKLCKEMRVAIGNAQKGAKNYLEAPVKRTDGTEEVPIVSVVPQLVKDDLDGIVSKNTILNYHIRVHLVESEKNQKLELGEFINLQYLALLLHSLYEIKKDTDSSEDFFKKRISVFIVPYTGNNYPFTRNGCMDSDSYLLVSQYLRMLSNNYKGVIYGAKKAKNERDIVVKALDFKNSNLYERFFPVIYIDYGKYSKYFNNTLDEKGYDKLFGMGKRARLENSRDENPEKAFGDAVLETAIKRVRYMVSCEGMKRDDIVNRMQFIKKVLLEEEKGCSMQFCLFAFMLNASMDEDEETCKKAIKYIWHLAEEICQGLKQVVLNSVQHSEMKGCYLSFCLHRSEIGEDSTSFSESISQRYEQTILKKPNNSGYYEALEIYVADINEKNNMVTNFVERLSIENAMSHLLGHKQLLENNNKIVIRNFFSEFEEGDLKEEWINFRKQDLVAHIGLSLFALTADRCKASVKVISNSTFKLEGEQNFFYKSYSSGNSNRENVEYIVPGTQFSILIPIHEWEEDMAHGLGQLQPVNKIMEKYSSFAKYLEYKEIKTDITKREGVNADLETIMDANKKFRLVNKWTKYWLGKFEGNISIANNQDGKYVFQYDFENVSEDNFFRNQDNMEVCMKGLIGALHVVEQCKGPFLLALTELPNGTMELFRKTCILHGVRKFPENLQLFLCEKEHEHMMTLIGRDYASAIYNSYILALEHGINGFEQKDYLQAVSLKNKLLGATEEKNEELDKEIDVFPFDAVLKCSEENKKTFFEEHIEKMVENSLDKEGMGYKLEDTHMRLGSKVHIHSFYEMSSLFYRTTIANRMAYIILKRMLAENQWSDIKSDAVIFYGYASYSKAILTSLTEILRLYREKFSGENENEKNESKVGFASYEHNLHGEYEKIHLYFELPEDFPGKVMSGNILHLKEDVKVIQIVPISTTLTTFNKIWSMFYNSVSSETRELLSLNGNYTLFWVVDSKGVLKEGKLSDIEKKYLEEIVGERKVKTKFKDLRDKGYDCVDYFIYSPVTWEDPLKCELCYPEKVIDEIPLVETDPTSSVPSQQIRYSKNLEKGRNKNKSQIKDNNERLIQLKECVAYGHISRRQNHYQYYIDTQRYFYRVKNDVKKWLEEVKEEMPQSNWPKLHIIFSPEHNTNVGFAQYVNTYYFDGLAEIISFNVDKEFRSNFKCEHAALIQLIEKLHQGMITENELPVKFYFVDDTIISGETFQKANNFMHSLIPNELKKKYPANLFQKVFLLVDRLSNETKSIYVNDIANNFLSFVHIDISNIRTQGDSCIGCKLKQNAKRMFKRSSTRNSAKYWADKLKCYKKIPYDDRTKMEKITNIKSYQRLIVTHILQNVIVNNGNSVELGEVYDALLDISLWMLSEEEKSREKSGLITRDKRLYNYITLLGGIKGIEGLQMVLKVICRPFFSYDFKIRLQVLTFYVFLTELLLGSSENDIISGMQKKDFVQQRNRIGRTTDLAIKIKEKLHGQEILTFLQNYLFEGLTDMGSTYLMRKQTLQKTYNWVENNKDFAKIIEDSDKADFWNNYSINVFRLIASNADETRELWLEYLYLCGEEYREVLEKNSNNMVYRPQFLYETVTGKKEPEKKDFYFYQFCHELFLHSTGINFDGIEEDYSTGKENEKIEDKYFMDYWREKRCLEKFKINTDNSEKVFESEKMLFKLLDVNKDFGIDEKDSDSVSQKYDDLLDSIVGIINEKYYVLKDDINIALVTESMDEEEQLERIQRLDIVSQQLNNRDMGLAATRFEIKDRIVNALVRSDDTLFELEKNGYMISENGGEENQRPYIIIFFDNPNYEMIESAGRSLQRIQRVFLYLSVSKKENDFFILRFILRDILTFRNRILRFLEKDFSGDIFAQYARKLSEKNIVSHEKANSHNTTADDEISVEIFVRPEIIEKYKVLKKDTDTIARWLLLRNYVNGQIAKIFNRSFQTSYELIEKDVNVPDYYLQQDKAGCSKALFKKKLDKFSRLGMEQTNESNIDGRFKFLYEIIHVKKEETLNDAEFIKGHEGYYNLEYFKCILIDIFMSAIKYQSDRADYLLRVDRFLEIEGELAEAKVKNDKELITEYERACCQVEMFREKTEDANVDYLVIRNPVKKIANNLVDWKDRNEIIKKRLADPLDYVDGHMSMLATKRYVEKLNPNIKAKCQFEYVEYEKENEKKGLFFETRLPVLNAVKDNE